MVGGARGRVSRVSGGSGGGGGGSGCMHVCAEREKRSVSSGREGRSQEGTSERTV